MTADSHDSLHAKIDEIGSRHGCDAVGVSVHDYADDSDFSHHGSEWFHAASTIKVVLLLALYKAAESGTVRLDDRLHVRNRFRSIVDGPLTRSAATATATASCTATSAAR
jgi:beta-lactamase class A